MTTVRQRSGGTGNETNPPSDRRQEK
jgi:hypothetical protein